MLSDTHGLNAGVQDVIWIIMSVVKDCDLSILQLTSSWKIAMPGNAHNIVHETES